MHCNDLRITVTEYTQLWEQITQQFKLIKLNDYKLWMILHDEKETVYFVIPYSRKRLTCLLL